MKRYSILFVILFFLLTSCCGEDCKSCNKHGGLKKFYVYIKEGPSHVDDYSDNTGGCSFSVRKIGWESCYADDDGSSTQVVSGPGEPVLCPAPYCDYYVIYDSGQTDRMTFSAYVNVCETIYRSHEICELGKLMLGVKLPEVEVDE